MLQATQNVLINRWMRLVEGVFCVWSVQGGGSNRQITKSKVRPITTSHLLGDRCLRGRHDFFNHVLQISVFDFHARRLRVTTATELLR